MNVIEHIRVCFCIFLMCLAILHVMHPSNIYIPGVSLHADCRALNHQRRVMVCAGMTNNNIFSACYGNLIILFIRLQYI